MDRVSKRIEVPFQSRSAKSVWFRAYEPMHSIIVRLKRLIFHKEGFRAQKVNRRTIVWSFSQGSHEATLVLEGGGDLARQLREALAHERNDIEAARQ